MQIFYVHKGFYEKNVKLFSSHTYKPTVAALDTLRKQHMDSVNEWKSTVEAKVFPRRENISPRLGGERQGIRSKHIVGGGAGETRTLGLINGCAL